MKNSVAPLSELEASYTVYAQAQYYPTFVRVFIPVEPYDRLQADLEVRDPLERISNPSLPDKETNLERAIRRARKSIKDIIFCNAFDMFATLTIAHDRQNPAHSKAKIANWVHNETSRKGKFRRLIVPEFHSDKQSLHFHALFGGYSGEHKQSFSAAGAPILQRGRPVYELPSFTSGFTNVKLIDKDTDSATKVGFYVQKYITKDMPILFGKNRYWPSVGLKRPVREDNPELWYKAFKPSREYENDYGRIVEFDLGANPIVDTFIEAHKP